MANIAVELKRAVDERRELGRAESLATRVLAEGPGWSVTDLLCTAGPHDRSFEEQHQQFSVSLVTAGTFQYRSGSHCEMMTPGSLLLGNAGQCFACSHEHGEGDRCLSFKFQPELFAEIAAESGARRHFPVLRIPPARELSPLVARALSGAEKNAMAWEELAIALAARAAHVAGESAANATPLPAGALARVTRVVRRLDLTLHAPHTVESLACEARLSRFHFLRTFERLTGLTPHQYILRARLRQAAVRLLRDNDHVLDIALDCGFGDVSNFNRAFRTEFGMSPRAYRAQ